MNRYEHTQPGTLIRGLMLLSLTLSVVPVAMAVFSSDAPWWLLLIPTVVFPGLLVLFHSLTVTVTASEVTAAFGIGVVRKTVLLEDIESAEAVQSRWYYGWGIRKVSRGWLYNVSGFDAVSLTMKNGRVVWLGTDDQEQLLAAIQTALSEQHD